MSCGGCETVQICVAGNTYFASIQYNIRGEYVSGFYTDENFQKVLLVGGSFNFGSCPSVPDTDVKRLVQPLVAGNNIIVHGMGAVDNGSGFATEVEVRNAVNGSIITARTIAETANSVTIFVPVAVASARISIDV